MTTWRKLLEFAMRYQADAGPVVAFAPRAEAFEVEWSNSHGSPDEPPDVSAWTEARVYFPVEYDGARWIESAPRHPAAEGQEPVGGPAPLEVLDSSPWSRTTK